MESSGRVGSRVVGQDDPMFRDICELLELDAESVEYLVIEDFEDVDYMMFEEFEDMEAEEGQLHRAPVDQLEANILGG